MTEETVVESAAETKAKKERVETKVTMSDGREVIFVGKRKLLKDTIIAEGVVVPDEYASALQVRLDFLNAETRLVSIPASLLLKAAGHGLEQKLGDECAGVDDVDDQVLGVDELIEQLSRGEWTSQRASSGISGTSILFKALCEAYPNKTPEEIKAFLKPKSPAEKIAMRNSAKLKPIVEKLEAEKASGAKVNAEALLESLG